MQDYFPLSDTPNIRSNMACYALIDYSQSSIGYINLTGRFPKRSSCRNEYILIGYHYDRNYIHGIPVKNRKGSSISAGWKELNNIFKSMEVALEIYVLDNQISQDLRDAFNEELIQY